MPIHVGALQAVEDVGVEVSSYLGTSAGAIVAALAADGMKAREMWSLVRTLDFSKFVKRTWPEVVANFFFGRGLVSGAYRHDFFRELFGIKTMADLRNLKVFGHSLARRRWVEISATSYPGMPVALALQISTAIPILFSPVGIGKVSRKTKREFDRDWLVDGGVSKNFPVDRAGRRFVGHLIDSPEGPDWQDISVRSLFRETFSQLVGANAEESIRNASPNGLVVRSTYRKSVTDFSVSAQEKENMFDLGYAGMSESLKIWLKEECYDKRPAEAR